MNTLFVIKLIGWICVLWGYWDIVASENRKENIPLIIFMGGVIVMLAVLWTENGTILNLLDPFVC